MIHDRWLYYIFPRVYPTTNSQSVIYTSNRQLLKCFFRSCTNINKYNTVPGPSCFWNFSTRRLVSSYCSGVKSGFWASKYLLHVSSSFGIGNRGKLSWKWYVWTMVFGSMYLSSTPELGRRNIPRSAWVWEQVNIHQLGYCQLS